jgi:hypothetical protein
VAQDWVAATFLKLYWHSQLKAKGANWPEKFGFLPCDDQWLRVEIITGLA